ncbi:MAG: C1 family peptidase [Bacteroidota bacterium]
MKRNRPIILLVFLALTNSGLKGQETQPDKGKGYEFTMVKSIPASPVKDQYKSGTCWSFAATSFFESELLRFGYDTIDISEMFFVYHAYHEKANNYVRFHGNANFGPGGQAHDVLNVIRKHGFVTEQEYPGLLKGEEKHKHGELDAILKAYLEAVITNKDGKLSLVWKDAFRALLDTYLGQPETSLNQAEIRSEKIFPRFRAEDYIELTSYNHHPCYELFELEIPDNWSHDLYYNLPVDELVDVINHALTQGYTVCWDGDVSDKGFSHANGVAIVPGIDIKSMEGTERARWEKMTEKERNAELFAFRQPGKEKKITPEMRQETFDNFQSTDDHLMHLTGMVSDQNGTVYYVTKNSWAANSNETGGYLNLSESYVRLNTIAVMVHIDALPSDLKKKLKL